MLLRFLAPLLVVLLTAPAGAQTATLPLAAPPVGPNAAASAIFDAMLAISRAVSANPAAAQAASFSYAQAMSRYQAGDLPAAQREALQAASLAAQNPSSQPQSPASAVAPAAFARGLALPRIVNPAQADAEAFLAVTRRALATCAVTDKAQRADLDHRYAAAITAYGAGKYTDVRSGARAIIDACATSSGR
jgi:hypothetical protein